MINEYIENRMEEIAKANDWEFEGIEHNGTAAFHLGGEREYQYPLQWLDITTSGFEIYDLVWHVDETRSCEKVVSPILESWKMTNSEAIIVIQELLRLREALAKDVKETEK